MWKRSISDAVFAPVCFRKLAEVRGACKVDPALVVCERGYQQPLYRYRDRFTAAPTIVQPHLGANRTAGIRAVSIHRDLWQVICAYSVQDSCHRPLLLPCRAALLKRAIATQVSNPSVKFFIVTCKVTGVRSREVSHANGRPRSEQCH